MAKDYSRSDRVAQQMQREIAQLIRDEIKDPRIGRFVTVTDVEVTRDLSHAKVFYTLMSGEDEETWKTLMRSAGFLRNELGRRIKLFRMPELQFVYDHSVEHGMTLDQLIAQANATRAADDAEAAAAAAAKSEQGEGEDELGQDDDEQTAQN